MSQTPFRSIFLNTVNARLAQDDVEDVLAQAESLFASFTNYYYYKTT